MDDSIVDVDEALLSDSFYQPSDECFDDIQAIVQQWKAVETANDSQNEDKFFDTRTFTRPPKKRFSNIFMSNNTFGASASAAVTEKQQQPINLQIGGLVTSMQRSFLGDVSPPTSFSSNETSMMANSLITSIDFANVSYFMNASNGGSDATTHHIANQTMNNYHSTQQKHYQPMANSDTFDQMTLENLLNTSPPASIPSDQSYAVQTENILNSTFATVTGNKTLVVHNATSDPIAEEDEDQCLSVTISKQHEEPQHQSTPLRSTAKFEIASPFEDVSPISTHTYNPRRRSTFVKITSGLSNQNNETFTPPPPHLVPKQPSAPVSPEATFIRQSTFVQSDLADSERQSLTNFEEYEKSLSTLKNEEDFENLLNSMGNNQSQLKNDKMRLSLDYIKKRHSLLNMEKQQESLLRRSGCDSNKLIESMEKSMGSSTSSGSRLLRRSRLFDDISPLQSTEAIIDTKNQVNETIAAAAAAPSRENQDQSAVEEPPVDTNNRDRFKTIRISKKTPDSSVPSMREVFSAGLEPNNELSNERFAKIDVNSPQLSHRNGVIVPKDPQNLSATSSASHRQMPRPRQVSGLTKREFPAKSSSVDSLSNRTPARGESKPTARSAMGSKSKSIQSLVGNSNRQLQRMNICDIAVQPDSDVEGEGVFKVPVPIVNQRHNVARKTGLIRPSSGYYSHTVKRNDSDTESGRLSPSSSLSSGSSKSSLHKIGVASSRQSDTNREDSPPVTAVSAPVSRASSVQPVAKRSGLQIPTNYRRSGLPRPMSMAAPR